MEIFLKKKYLDIWVVGFLVLCAVYNGFYFSCYLHTGEKVLQLESQIDVYEVAFLMIYINGINPKADFVLSCIRSRL
jgi:hypothetical protein